MSKQIQVAVLVAAGLLLTGGGFVAGMTLGPDLGGKANASGADAQAGRQQQGAARTGGAGATGAGAIAGGAGGQTVGRVISVNNDSITVEIRTPGSDTARSVIALVGTTARIVKTTETDIKLGDINAGDQVLVVGQTDPANGTISATAIVDGFSSLQQVFGGGARPSGSGGAPRPSPSGSPRP